MSLFRFSFFVVGTFTVFLSAFTAAAQLRPMVYSDITVERSAEDAYADWLDERTLEAFFAVSADVEKVSGGRYKLCFDADAPEGDCGNDNGRILALQEGRMISFTWAMPPYMPEIRPHLTSVQLLFEPQSDSRTRVRLFHTGFGESDVWLEGRDYFAKTWPRVLQAYRVEAETAQR